MIQPPTNPKAELTVAIATGIVAAIPWFGGVIAEVGNLYLNPLEKRKQVWMNEVSLAIEEIQERFSLLPESLEEDDAFISFLYQATVLALRNHQQEKIDALRNALVSSADPTRSSEDLVFQFLRYIDELSVTHLQILADLDKHAGQFARLDQFDQIYDRFQTLMGQSIDRPVFRTFVQDLDVRFLIRIGDIDEFSEYASQLSLLELENSKKRPLEVTTLGREFLSFVQNKQ